MRVHLADLNHGGHNAKTFPYAAGCVASYALQQLGDALEVELFKEPEALGEAFLRERPEVVGFSNYIWNACLSLDMVRRMKAHQPGLVAVFGGPNFPSVEHEQREHMERYREVDFWVRREGELAFVELLRALEKFSFDAPALRAEGLQIPGVLYLRGTEVVEGPPCPKIVSVDSVPSPYLAGLFDKFFAQNLAPLMQFIRGCPFSCTFCTEGDGYYSKLGRSSPERFLAEAEYVALRVQGQPPLYLADANFGMYKEDVELCQRLGEIQDRLGWPEIIITATGKNQKERVIQASNAVKGAFRVAAAIQSSDATVLKNIKRANISTDKLMEAAHLNTELEQESFAEIILNLPGDSPARHRDSIRTVVNAGITRIQIYPLLFLPGTELASDQTKAEYGFVTRFRILPRCFGHYRFGDTVFPSAEVVELPVASNTMTLEDYLDCKEFDLSVELFYNDDCMAEICGLLRQLGREPADFVEACHRERSAFPPELDVIYRELREMSAQELWESREGLSDWLTQGGNLRDYERVEYRNSLATNRAIALLTCADAIHDVAGKAVSRLLQDHPREVQEYAAELIRFSRLRKHDLLDAAAREAEFTYDLAALMKARFVAAPEAHRVAQPVKYRFYQRPETAAEIRRHYEAHSERSNALRNVLYHSAHVRVGQYFRLVEPAAQLVPS